MWGPPDVRALSEISAIVSVMKIELSLHISCPGYVAFVDIFYNIDMLLE